MAAPAMSKLLKWQRPCYSSPLEAVASTLGAVHATSHTLRQQDGVPITSKANIAAGKMLLDASSGALKDYIAPYLSTAADRLCKQGAEVVGVTNMDEFGMGSATQFSIHGPCVNPWSPAVAVDAELTGRGMTPKPSGTEQLRSRRGWLVPGGSSGGAAVSVAIGLSAISLGSDTGGSVRQPAAFNGGVGFKPSYGRIPRHGLISYASSLDTVGLLAGSVWDAAVGYSVTAGYDARDDSCVRAPHRPWDARQVQEVLGVRPGTDTAGTVAPVSSKPLSGLRVGLPVEYAPGDSQANAAASAAWESAAQALRDAGATVVQVSLRTTKLALPAYYVLAPAEAASNLSRYDGVRYGHRTSADTEQAKDSRPGMDDSAAAALHEMYTRTRSEGFGPEVQRRVMLGNFVMSQAARGQYYDAALAAREAVRADFAGVFRPRQTAAGGQEDDGIEALGLLHTMNPAAHPSAASDAGVDVLLTPVAPCPPWAADPQQPGGQQHTPQDPLRDYLQDVMTIPASLAGLPAIAVPVATVPCEDSIVRAAVEDGAAAYGLDGQQQEQLMQDMTGPKRPILPMGVQLIGRYCDEATVLRVAAALEDAVGFQSQVHGRKPWERLVL